MARKGSDRAATGTENLSVLRRGALACPRAVCLAPLPRLPGRCARRSVRSCWCLQRGSAAGSGSARPPSSSRRVRRQGAERLDLVAVADRSGGAARFAASAAPRRQQAQRRGARPRATCTARTSARGGRGKPIASRSRSSISAAIACAPSRLRHAREPREEHVARRAGDARVRLARSGSSRARTRRCTARTRRRSAGMSLIAMRLPTSRQKWNVREPFLLDERPPAEARVPADRLEHERREHVEEVVVRDRRSARGGGSCGGSRACPRSRVVAALDDRR